MKPNYLYFNDAFINYFVQDFRLQSADYGFGENFKSLLLQDSITNQAINDKYFIIDDNNGRYIIDLKSTETQGFMIDFENLHNYDYKSEDILLLLTRLFRFYIKQSRNMPLSYHEAHIANTNNYIVNPFNFSVEDFYKIIISINPDNKRNESRDINVYLNINDGWGVVKQDGYSLTNYRKIKSSLINVKKVAEEIFKKESRDEDKERYINSREKIIDEISNYIGYDNWGYYLTNPQKKFIFSNSLGPSRIIGPAGSGKTLSLILKTIYLAKEAKKSNIQRRIGFICHSQAMRDNVLAILNYDAAEFLNENGQVYIEVITLVEWLVKYAIKGFKLDDCLEIDSQDIKLMQLLYIENSIKKFLDEEYRTYEPLLSKRFKEFVTGKDNYNISEIIGYEISIYIKGSLVDDLGKYIENADNNKLVPWENREDLSAIFRIYDIYQKNIESLNKYDIDDICQVGMGYLPRQIWKRNRHLLGYDSVLIDELQLFNFSELQIVPYIIKDQETNHINTAYDSYQSNVEQRLVEENLNKYFKFETEQEKLSVVFRSTDPIIKLTQYLFDSNIDLFLKRNPLESIAVTIDSNIMPNVTFVVSDKQMYEVFIKNVEKIPSSRRNHLIICTDLIMVDKISDELTAKNISNEILKRRGDSSIQKRAIKNNAVLIAYIDFVGGLEFDYVTILGFDKNKVPPKNNTISENFNKQLWYRKIYVAMTRARNNLSIICNTETGIHEFIDSAIKKKLLVKIE